MYYIGSSDKDMKSHYHIFALALVKSESANAMRWVLETINDNLRLINEPALAFEMVMSDAPKGIIKRYKDFFGDDLLSCMCWFHVKLNVTNKSKVKF